VHTLRDTHHTQTVGEEFAPLIFSNVAGLSTRVAEQLIPTWAKFNGKTTVLSPAMFTNIQKTASEALLETKKSLYLYINYNA
jgi:hypothetical protein